MPLITLPLTYLCFYFIYFFIYLVFFVYYRVLLFFLLLQTKWLQWSCLLWSFTEKIHYICDLTLRELLKLGNVSKGLSQYMWFLLNVIFFLFRSFLLLNIWTNCKFVSHSGCVSPKANDWLPVPGLSSTLSSDSSCCIL